MKYCPRCGAPSADELAFCQNCGNRFPQTSQQPQTPNLATTQHNSFASHVPTYGTSAAQGSFLKNVPLAGVCVLVALAYYVILIFTVLETYINYRLISDLVLEIVILAALSIIAVGTFMKGNISAYLCGAGTLLIPGAFLIYVVSSASTYGIDFSGFLIMRIVAYMLLAVPGFGFFVRDKKISTTIIVFGTSIWCIISFVERLTYFSGDTWAKLYLFLYVLPLAASLIIQAISDRTR